MRAQVYESPTQEEAACLLLLAFCSVFVPVELDDSYASVEARLGHVASYFLALRRGLKDGWGPYEVMGLLGSTFSQRVDWLERHGLVELREEPPDPEHGGPQVTEGRRTAKGESLIARVIAA